MKPSGSWWVDAAMKMKQLAKKKLVGHEVEHTKQLSISLNSGTLIKLDNLIMSKNYFTSSLLHSLFSSCPISLSLSYTHNNSMLLLFSFSTNISLYSFAPFLCLFDFVVLFPRAFSWSWFNQFAVNWRRRRQLSRLLLLLLSLWLVDASKNRQKDRLT